MKVRLPPHWSARGVALVLILLATATSLWQLREDRQITLQQGEILVSAMANAIDQHLDGSFRAIDGLLDEVAQAVASGRWNSPAFQAWLAVRLNNFPEIRYIGVVDAKGRLRPDTVPSILLPSDGLDLAARPYFVRQQQSTGVPAMDVGEPVQDPVTHERSIHLSRPVRDTGGRFAGMVVAAVDPDGYARFLETVLLEDKGGSAVIRTDGLILARAPGQAEAFGTSLAGGVLLTRFLPAASAGAGRVVATPDGNDKLLGYRLMEHYPLVVTSGLSIDTALGPWRRLAWVEGVLVTVFFVLLMYWARQSDLRQQNLQEHHDSLEVIVAERTGALSVANAVATRRLQRLTEVNRELHRLAQITSHHLQEPVRPIVSYAQMTRRKLANVDPEVDGWLQFIERGGLRLKSLLRDFQRYASILAEEPNMRPADMGDIANKALASLRREFPSTAAEVSIAPLPRVMVDPHLMEAVFHHLFDNATRHRHPDRPPVVAVTASEQDDVWRFDIADNGKGIEPDLAQKAFEAFEQLNGSSTGNTGLGLAVCRAIIQAHGGQIWIEHLAEGSRFSFTLPKMEDIPAA